MVDGKYKRDYAKTETETLTGAQLKQSLDIRLVKAREAEKAVDKVAEKEQEYGKQDKSAQSKSSASPC